MVSIALHLSENGVETVSFLDKDPAEREATINFYRLIQQDIKNLEISVVEKHKEYLREVSNELK